MTVTDRIELNPRVMLGKPVILLDAYPQLAKADIQAAIRFLRLRTKPDADECGSSPMRATLESAPRATADEYPDSGVRARIAISSRRARMIRL